MGLPPLEQAINALNKATRVLIALPRHASTDAISSALALHAALEKKDKESQIAGSDFAHPTQHHFLIQDREVPIHRDLRSGRKFVINLDVSNAEVDELSYDIQGTSLKIFITPKKGFFTPQHVTTEDAAYPFDLIITIDTPDLQYLGSLFEEHSEFFYHTPIMNIDHSAANENFGEINLVELTATSTSEILFEVFRAWDEHVMDEHIATALLTGIISKTKSFQAASVTPKSLTTASHLIDCGARREEIIRNLYQTKSISTLKLWGRTLARLKQDQTQAVMWSLISKKDFEKTGAEAKDVLGVIDELIINTPNAKIVAILYQSPERANEGTHLLLHTPKSMDAMALLQEFHPYGNGNFTECVLPDAQLSDAEKRLLTLLRVEERL